MNSEEIYCEEVNFNNSDPTSSKLQSSDILKDLDKKLSHLAQTQREELKMLTLEYKHCYEMKCITRVSPNLLVNQLIVGKYGTRSIWSPRMICEILPCSYHLFGKKSTSNLQLLDFILLTI